MSYLQGLAALSSASQSGGGHGDQGDIGVSPSTPIQVSSFGVNLGQFMPSMDASDSSGTTPLFAAPNQEIREQGTVTEARLPGNVPPIYLALAVGAFLLLSKRRR